MSAVEQVCIMDGQFVGTMLIPFSHNPSKRLNKKVICPLCREQIEDGTTGRFFGCNYKHFPNSVCHPECVEKVGGFQAVAEKLREMNERFQKLKAEMRNEFGTIGWLREEVEHG